MGDRGNIAIEQSTTPGDRVYLYSHWGGSELPGDLKTALAKQWRWDDPAYLARIVFDVMTRANHGEETGFGISTHRPDNEHPILVVNCGTQAVTAETERGKVTATWTFAEYLALDDPDTTVGALASR